MTTPAGDQSLWLGTKKDHTVYARLGAGGPVVLVDAALATEIDKTLASLEDRRLWSGAIPAVHQVVWGPPRQDLDRPERPGCLEDHRAGPGGHAAACGAPGDGPARVVRQSLPFRAARISVAESGRSGIGAGLSAGMLLNFVAFQCGWFACVLGAARGWPWAGTAVAGAIVGAHVLRAARPPKK